MQDDTVASVLQKHSRQLLSLTGVVGFAEGESGGKPCIRIFVARKTPQLINQIPQALEGYAVCVEETGYFRAL